MKYLCIKDLYAQEGDFYKGDIYHAVAPELWADFANLQDKEGIIRDVNKVHLATYFKPLTDKETRTMKYLCIKDLHCQDDVIAKGEIVVLTSNKDGNMHVTCLNSHFWQFPEALLTTHFEPLTDKETRTMKYLCIKDCHPFHKGDFASRSRNKIWGYFTLTGGEGVPCAINDKDLEDNFRTVADTPTIADRKNDGKIPLSYMLDFPIAMIEFCRVCMNGAKKYNRDNWKKGRPYRDTIDSLLRHIQAFQDGEGYYEETLDSGEVVKFHHMANAMWNCAALLEWSLSDRKDLDDRYKKDAK